jgi:rare lipoprotein A
VRLRPAIRLLTPALCAGILALPALALAAGATPSTGGTTSSPAAGSLSSSPASVLLGHVLVVRGVLDAPPPATAGLSVLLERLTASGAWIVVAHRPAGSGGAFAIGWRARTLGRVTLRVVRASSAVSAAAATSSELQVTVYRSVLTTWYGPGFYGHRTACGETLTRHILGVAHRTLACGTPVELSYDGRTLTVPVIDRGPYAEGASLDLTYAAARVLGVTRTVSIGALALAGPPLAPVDFYWPGSGPTATGPTGASGASGASSGSTSASGGTTAPAS